MPETWTIDEHLVRALVAEQFPQWADAAVCPVACDGWDNRTFHVGDVLSARLPSGAWYAPQVDKEVAWLPHLAALDLPIPQIVGVGVPGCGYPYAWTIRPWIEGVPLAQATQYDPATLARDIALFLVNLRALEPIGPSPGAHSAGRGARLDQWDQQVRDAVAALPRRVDGHRALEVWDRALACSDNSTASWFHGDVAPGNLLVGAGRLCAVIDFGLAGVGDPACDYAIAWTTFAEPERRILREVSGVEDPMWQRGKGWALWKALISVDDPRHARESARALAALGVAC